MMRAAFAPTVNRMAPDIRRRIYAPLLERVEVNVYIVQLFAVVAVARGNEFQGIETSLFGRRTAPHIFDHRTRAVDVDDLFAAAGRAGRTRVIVNIQPAADQGRVADATGYLPRQTARRGHAADVEIFIERETVDRAGQRLCRDL